MKFNTLGVCALLFSLLAGCVSVQMADEAADATAKQFLPPPVGKSTLYIYRNEYFGNTVAKAVVVNGVVIGETAGHTFFRLNVRPGNYFISSLSTEHSMSGGINIPVSMKEGNTYFVWQEIKTGGSAWFHLVDEQTGKAGVKESFLASRQVSENLIQPDENASSDRSLPSSDTTHTKIQERLQLLKKLLNEGLILEQEYQQKKEQVLRNL